MKIHFLHLFKEGQEKLSIISLHKCHNFFHLWNNLFHCNLNIIFLKWSMIFILFFIIFYFARFYIWWKLKIMLEFHFHTGTLTKQALDGIIGCKINLTPFAYEVDFWICRSKLVMDRVPDFWVWKCHGEMNYSSFFAKYSFVIFDEFSKWSALPKALWNFENLSNMPKIR